MFTTFANLKAPLIIDLPSYNNDSSSSSNSSINIQNKQYINHFMQEIPYKSVKKNVKNALKFLHHRI